MLWPALPEGLQEILALPIRGDALLPTSCLFYKPLETTASEQVCPRATALGRDDGEAQATNIGTVVFE